MSEYKIGERIRVFRTTPRVGEHHFSDNYPKIGWKGTVTDIYGTHNGVHEDQVSVEWDEEFLENAKNGDLVYLWQIDHLKPREWDDDDNL